MLRTISIKSKMANFGNVKLRKSGNSNILTVPSNPYTKNDQKYQAYLRRDGLIIYKPIN